LCAAHAVLEAGGKAETLPEAFGEVPVQGKNKASAIISRVFSGSR
jgi:hypothetical protein